MELREINELIDRFETSDLTVLEYEKAGSRLRIEKESRVGTKETFTLGNFSEQTRNVVAPAVDTTVVAATAADTPATSVPSGEHAPTAPTAPTGEAVQGDADATPSTDPIKSPIVGIFYQSSAPDAAPFVEVGSQVKKGEVLCILEAMKVMNEIKAPYDLVIRRIAVNDGDMVDVGRVMFEVEAC